MVRPFDHLRQRKLSMPMAAVTSLMSFNSLGAYSFDFGWLLVDISGERA